MIAPQTLAGLLADDPLSALKGSIVTTLSVLLPGIRIVSHAGKLDVADVVAKAVVEAPGVMVGWTRMRPGQIRDGSFHLPVELVAYIVAGDAVVADRRVEREAVGLAIGRRLLQIVADRETATWGRDGLTPPAIDPPPEFKPVFTARDFGQGLAYFAVTWTQTLVDQGHSLFDGPMPVTQDLVDEEGWAAAEASFEPGYPAEMLRFIEESSDA